MTSGEVVVIGLGKTGLSCLRYCVARQKQVRVVDTRENHPDKETIQREFPHVLMHFGTVTPAFFEQASLLVVSPGVDLNDSQWSFLQGLSIPQCGDFDLFCQEVSTPMIAITGSNGKTTVTHLLTALLNESGRRAQMVGNVGTPVLDALAQEKADPKAQTEFFVVECSSFQLETNQLLSPKVACLLNVTPDHMDRHRSFEAYWRAKQRVFDKAEYAVYYRGDRHTVPPDSYRGQVIGFDVTEPVSETDWGLRSVQGQLWLAQGSQCLMPVSELSLQHRHEWLNCLAACAMGHCLGLPWDSMRQALRQFNALPHRMQWVSGALGVQWWNDSKATNVGATIAAIDSLKERRGERGRLFLIAGGDSKDADLSSLQQRLWAYVDTVFLLGKDADKISALAEGCSHIEKVRTIEEAVLGAAKLATEGDHVLLSPACASLDMFRDYTHRGDVFVQAIEALGCASE